MTKLEEAITKALTEADALQPGELIDITQAILTAVEWDMQTIYMRALESGLGRGLDISTSLSSSQITLTLHRSR